MQRIKASLPALLAPGISLCLLAFFLQSTRAGRAQTSDQPSGTSRLPADAPKPPYKRLTGPETLNPGEYPAHFPYPDEYDSVVAAAEVHHLRYIDSSIRFVEVAYFPGVQGQMHGHPFPSVFIVDAPTPNVYNLQLDPQNPIHINESHAPQGAEYPICKTMNPQAPHSETNLDTWPHHFYRIEFLRVDGKAIQDHWKEWYPNMLRPLALARGVSPAKDASPFSAGWPYPIAYDSIEAAPNNNKLLYEDDHVRLVEVTIRPGETEPMEGVPYPSVLAFNSMIDSTVEDHPLDRKSTPAEKSAGHAGPPSGFDLPTCTATSPQPPHVLRNTGKTPIHYYRIELKRIDGNGLRTHWREWYPWLGAITDAYRERPYVSNFH